MKNVNHGYIMAFVPIFCSLFSFLEAFFSLLATYRLLASLSILVRELRKEGEEKDVHI
jgi:hypothetical protein